MAGYGWGTGSTSGDFIQKVIVPTEPFRSIAGDKRIWLGAFGSKLITPLRPSSLSTQLAKLLVPACPPPGLESTITSSTGATSKLKRTFNELSITAAPHQIERTFNRLSVTSARTETSAIRMEIANRAARK